MKNRMRLLVGLLVLGVILIGGSIWLLIAPEKQSEALYITFTPLPDSYLNKLPETPPVIFEKLEYVMRGEFDYFYIYSDGSVIYVEEKGLRMPMPDHPPTRTWKSGKLQEEELTSLIALFQSIEFNALNDYYLYPGKPMDPIQGVPSGGIIQGDGSFTFSINYAGFQKQVIANGFLTPDHGATYPDMPFPLNEMYVKLRNIALNQTKEITKETMPLGSE